MNHAISSFILSISFLFLPFTSLRAETGFLAQEARLAWDHRDKPGQTEQAIQKWELATKSEPARTDLWIPLTRACGRAVRHAKTVPERRLWADRARIYGTKAAEMNPASSEAHAAYGEALGQWANAHKGIHSLKSVREAVLALERAIALDPKNAYAHMLLASFYREAPGVISVGSKAKALAEAKLAVETGPGYAINHLVLAKVYLDLGRKTAAIPELESILTLPPPADAIPETQADKETASSLLRELGIAPPPLPSCGETGGYCAEEKHP